MFESWKEKFNVWKEKKEFLQDVNENTKHLRRQSYLEQKKQQAGEEGKILAQKEMEKQKQELAKEKQRTENMKGIGSYNPFNGDSKNQNKNIRGYG